MPASIARIIDLGPTSRAMTPPPPDAWTSLKPDATPSSASPNLWKRASQQAKRKPQSARSPAVSIRIILNGAVANACAPSRGLNRIPAFRAGHQEVAESCLIVANQFLIMV